LGDHTGEQDEIPPRVSARTLSSSFHIRLATVKRSHFQHNKGTPVSQVALVCAAPGGDPPGEPPAFPAWGCSTRSQWVDTEDAEDRARTRCFTVGRDLIRQVTDAVVVGAGRHGGQTRPPDDVYPVVFLGRDRQRARASASGTSSSAASRLKYVSRRQCDAAGA
jgi:hypothetical protein